MRRKRLSQARAANIAKQTHGRSRKFKNKKRENKKNPPMESDNDNR